MVDKKVKDVIRPNVVDGIEEYDNPLPSWWLWVFNLTIVFGVLYLIWYHVIGKPGLEDELAADRAAHLQTVAVSQQQATTGTGELATRIKDPQLIADGKGIFGTNCSPCHGQLGEGTVGPNLTDRFWLHGGSPEQVLNTITQGVPAKGMIAWGPILGTQKIEAVLSYVMSLQDSNPPNAKAPQGEPN